MIENISAVLVKIKKTSGRNYKIALLKKSAELPGFKEVLHFLFNPYERTSIGLKKLEGNKTPLGPNDRVIDVIEAIQYFKENPTGTDANVYWARKFIESQLTEEAKEIAKAICLKKYVMGVTDKTLRQVYGDDFIARIGVMLGEKYYEFKDKVKGPYITTEKLDGHRRLLIKEDGKISVYTRSGLPDEGLVDIEAEAAHLPDNCVYDGEALAIGVFKNALVQRQATNSIMNRSGIRTGVSFNLFDSVPLADFKAGTSVEMAIQRKIFLGALFGDTSIYKFAPRFAVKENITEILVQFKLPYDFKLIKPVPILGVVDTEEEILELADPIWARGFEGVMALVINSYYEIKRSRMLLKVKATESMDLTVIDMEEGKAGGKFVGTLGHLIVDYKGFRVGVGSGYDDAIRAEIWNNKEKYLGRTIEIDTFGETTNAKDGGLSLNCCIFKGFRMDK